MQSIKRWIFSLALLVLFCFGLFLLVKPRVPGRPIVRADIARGFTPKGGEGAEGASVTSSSLAPTSVDSPAVKSLFAFVPRPIDAARFEAAVSAPTDAIHYVRVDRELFTSKQSPFWKTGGGGYVEVPLPDGRVISVVIDKSQTLDAQRFTSRGRIDGQGYGRAVFSYFNGEVSAVIEDLEHGTWELRASNDGLAQFFLVDPSKVPPCGGDRYLNKKDVLASGVRSADQALSSGKSVPPGPGPAADSGPVTDVRLLLVYTSAVAQPFSNLGSLLSSFDLAVASVNDDLARSLVPVTVTLAKTAQVTYDETISAANKVEDDALNQLANTSDGSMDEVHPLRDQYGADLVCLTHSRHDSVSAGLAFILSPGKTTNQLNGFSVVDFSYLNIGSTLSHELGHNFGCAHDRENAKDSAGAPSKGAYAYSYGYRFTGANGVQYRTIMAYAPGSRVAYFSNPDIVAPPPISRAVGIAPGAAGEADNALTVAEGAFEVSSYRLSTQTPSNLGTLVNVSTRAYVGTGEQQLIGGFIISGTQPKKVLLRILGPSLARFGVPNVISDPTMTIYRLPGSIKIAENDNWSTAANAAEVAAAMQQFAPASVFASGSLDSALLLTLDPGAYSANIEGVKGTTGIGLIEAFEVDRNGNKLVNISTRGYADMDRVMIAGFIIQADPGNPTKTKRVLIRVLGPTLANFGVSGPMNDPTLSLYQNSTLLLINDDWSSGATLVNGTPDDFKPRVSIYSETQIAATGLAPQNRRDSAVLVDLAPGGYTAIVRPFEDLTSSPPQPAKPGVAIVEVYEINSP